MVSKVSRLFSKIGLSLSVEKCEFLVFNDPISSNAPLACRGFSIPFVSAFQWLGITITNSISCLRQCTVRDAQKKIQIGYSKIVANRGKYNRRALDRLHATFCDHSVLYLSGLYPLLKKNDVNQTWTFYFRYCKFLFISPLGIAMVR